jgi:anti-anti-sigma regulatory factor
MLVMLRVTVEERGDRVDFKIEGKLRGPWVPELERCWRSTASHTHAKLFSVDLDGVDFIDDQGKALLTKMAAAGVELTATGCGMRSIVQQIAAVSSRLRDHAEP